MAKQDQKQKKYCKHYNEGKEYLIFGCLITGETCVATNATTYSENNALKCPGYYIPTLRVEAIRNAVFRKKCQRILDGTQGASRGLLVKNFTSLFKNFSRLEELSKSSGEDK